MMNVITPTIECNSGCESGWTLYLEHSHSTSNNISLSYKNTSFQGKKLKILDGKQAHKDHVLFYEQGDEEEDLSMVSDASSGPPHFDHDNIDDEEVEENKNLYYYCNNNANGKKRSMTLYNKASNDDFALDDTASSHVFASKEIGGIRVQKNRERLIDYSSQGYSGTHAEVVLEKRKSSRR